MNGVSLRDSKLSISLQSGTVPLESRLLFVLLAGIGFPLESWPFGTFLGSSTTWSEQTIIHGNQTRLHQLKLRGVYNILILLWKMSEP